MLLVLSLLLGTFLLLFLAHELIEQLISLLTCLIKVLPALLNDFNSVCGVEGLGKGQGGVTILVAAEDVNLGILDDILEHLGLGTVLGGQVDDVVFRDNFLHEVVGVGPKEELDTLGMAVGRDNAQLEWREVLVLRLHARAFRLDTV